MVFGSNLKDIFEAFVKDLPNNGGFLKESREFSKELENYLGNLWAVCSRYALIFFYEISRGISEESSEHFF